LASTGSGLHIFGKAVLKGVTAEKLSCLAREHRIGWLAGAFVQPDAHDGDDTRSERSDPLLSPFPQATDVRSGAEMNIGASKADQLGHPQACLSREREQGVVTPTGPGRAIRRS
jgi:hypothetical protein